MTIISAGVQSAGQAIQFDEASREPGNATTPLPKFLDGFDRIHHLFFHGQELAPETIVADLENIVFYFIEKRSHFALFLVGAAHAFGAGGDDLAENIFVADDLEVVVDIRCRRDKGEQTGHERGAADCFQHILVAQHLGEGNEIDRLTRVPLFAPERERPFDAPECKSIPL